MQVEAVQQRDAWGIHASEANESDLGLLLWQVILEFRE